MISGLWSIVPSAWALSSGIITPSHSSYFGLIYSGTRVNQFHSSVTALAGHHWYPDPKMMKEYAGKDMLVSDEQWQKLVDIGMEVWLALPLR